MNRFISSAATETTMSTASGEIGCFKKSVATFALATVIGTSTVAPATGSPRVLVDDSSTNAGYVISSHVPPSATRVTARQITELKEISGLTWEHLGRVFGVDRRSIHYWAQGARLSASNAENLSLVLDKVREISRACLHCVDDVRTALLSSVSGDQLLVDRMLESSGGSRRADDEFSTQRKLKKLDVPENTELRSEISLIDRLSSSDERIPGGEGTPLRRIPLKKKPGV